MKNTPANHNSQAQAKHTLRGEAPQEQAMAQPSMNTPFVDPGIYVTDEGAYHQGILHGVWVDMTQSLGHIQQQIDQILADSPTPDAATWRIQDDEGFEGYHVSECEDLAWLHEVACFIREYPEMAPALLDHWRDDIRLARQAITEDYCGYYASLADYLRELTQDNAMVAEDIAFYVDYEKMGQDRLQSGDIYVIETHSDKIHVFWSR